MLDMSLKDMSGSGPLSDAGQNDGGAGGGNDAGGGNVGGGGGGDAGGSGGGGGEGGGASDMTVVSGELLLVGGSIGGTGIADGVGATARFNEPFGIASDGASIYVSADFAIRKIFRATGAVTTLAGSSGAEGTADGPAQVARFYSPGDIATDGASLFVADGSTVRRVVLSTGAVSTLAGAAMQTGSADGIGSAARFNAAKGIAYDGIGNLYVADTGNSTIRKIVVANGLVSTVAGQPGSVGLTDGVGSAARFDQPTGLATDGTNVYVADTMNNAIRQLVVATGAVTTLAGSTTAGQQDGSGASASFYNPYGIVLDGSGDLFIADTFNATIRRLVIATGTVSTPTGTANSAGSTDGAPNQARFNAPLGVASDGAGDVYITDGLNNTIRELNLATSMVTTIAGTAPHSGGTDGSPTEARFSGPMGIVEYAGKLYVADTNNNVVREIANGSVSTIAGTAGAAGSADGTGAAARFNMVGSIASDGNGNLFVADSGNSTIRKIVIATGSVTTLAGSAGTIGSADGTGGSALFQNPFGVAADGVNVYVADTYNNTIRKVVIATGAVTTLAGSAGQTGSADDFGVAARFFHPYGIGLDPAGGVLYVADTFNDTIRELVISTGSVSTIAGTALQAGFTDGTSALFSSPESVSAGMAGELYVADRGNSTVRKIILSARATSTMVGVPLRSGVLLGALPAGLNCPTSVLATSNGVVITDACENSVLSASP